MMKQNGTECKQLMNLTKIKKTGFFFFFFFLQLFHKFKIISKKKVLKLNYFKILPSFIYHTPRELMKIPAS